MWEFSAIKCVKQTALCLPYSRCSINDSNNDSDCGGGSDGDDDNDDDNDDATDEENGDEANEDVIGDDDFIVLVVVEGIQTWKRSLD